MFDLFIYSYNKITGQPCSTFYFKKNPLHWIKVMSDFRFTNRISFFKKHQLFAFFYLLLIGVLKRICQPLYKNNDFLLKLISISLVLGVLLHPPIFIVLVYFCSLIMTQVFAIPICNTLLQDKLFFRRYSAFIRLKKTHTPHIIKRYMHGGDAGPNLPGPGSGGTKIMVICGLVSALSLASAQFYASHCNFQLQNRQIDFSHRELDIRERELKLAENRFYQQHPELPPMNESTTSIKQDYQSGQYVKRRR